MASENDTNRNGSRRRKADIETARQRPEPLTVKPAGIPEALRERPQWVCWAYSRRNGRWTKILTDARTGRNAKSNDSATWATFPKALAVYDADRADGIGFVFSPDDPYSGVDIDDVRDPDTGEIDREAMADVRLLDSYSEVSPSGTGVKVIVRGKVPPGGNRRGHYELYDHSRFFALTGRKLKEAPASVAQRQKALDVIHARLFPPREATPASTGTTTTRPPLDLTDKELLHRARAAKNGDLFRALWGGDISAYDSHSEADAALVSLLSFWTGPDPVKIDLLFRQSGLMREKWEREDYRERTIAAALAGRTEFYTPPPAAIPRRGRGRKRHAVVTAAFTFTISVGGRR